MKITLLIALVATTLCLSGCRATSGESSVKDNELGAGAGFGDGCYDIVKAGADGGVVCVSGMAEEGLSGSGAEVAMLSPSGNPYRCFKTTGISVEGDTTILKVTVNNNPAAYKFKGGQNGELNLGGPTPWKYSATAGRHDLLKKARDYCQQQNQHTGGGPSNSANCYMPSAPELENCGTPVKCPNPTGNKMPSYCGDESWFGQTGCEAKSKLESEGCGTVLPCMMCGDE